jgi:phosphoribosylamine--glycine ligase
MINNNSQIKTLEFNCRMGDPETQPILFRLESDFFEILLAASEKKLGNYKAEWDQGSAITVVIAAKDYPNQPKINDEIFNLKHTQQDSYIFHAGTNQKDGKIYTSGGRVLGVTAKGDSLKDAQKKVYTLINKIKFNGMQYRTDIGQKVIRKNCEKS